MKKFLLLFALMMVLGTHYPVHAQLSNVTYGYIGNSFNGSSDRWMQNYIDEIEVASDGTVYTASEWDEAGRTIGYYKDGVPQTPIMKEYDGASGYTCWGWGTATKAIALDETYFYDINCEGDLLRFNTSNHLYVDKTAVGTCEGATCTGGKIYLVKTDGTIDVRNTSSLGTIALSFSVANSKDIAVDGDGNMWVLLTTNEILKYSPLGINTGTKITGTANWVPKSVSINNSGKLMVCDNGPDMQVKIYDISGVPALSSTFGDQGGIVSGTPGVITPTKFWQLAGAGTDPSGNIYVAMDDNSTGIRKFSSVGALVWEIYGLFFTDIATPDPDSDGTIFYGINEKMTYDFTNHNWTASSFTLDRINQTNDPRISNNGTSITSAIARRVNGNLLLFQQGMYAGEYNVYNMDGEIAIKQANIPNIGYGYPDRDGNVWYNNNGIKKVALTGFTGVIPNFSVEQNISSIPAPFTGFNVERVIYDVATDVMWLGGYTAAATNWGLIGTVIARYPNWSAGNRTASHTLQTRIDGSNLEPKAMAVCGDYVFTTNVRDNGSVYVYNASDLTSVGYIASGDAANSGWVDVPQGLQVFKRSNGLYMVIVEDNLRAKDWVYEWCPSGNCTNDIVSVTGVSVSPESLTLNGSQTAQLTATISPANANNKVVKWTSGNASVATVTSSGLVTGIAAGTATITVTTVDGGKTATCLVTVTNVSVTGVTVSPTSETIGTGGTTQLTATVSPTNALNKTVSWSSGDPTIATVSTSGLVTGIATGSAIITATTQDGGKTATCSITVISSAKLSGTQFDNVIPYDGLSVGNNAFDGNTATFVDANAANGVYTGLDFGGSRNVNIIKYYPRTGYEFRMSGGKFQGSDDNSSWTDIHTISGTPVAGWTEVSVNANYRYVRYLSPDGGYCNVAEIEFWGGLVSLVSVTGVSVSPVSASIVEGGTQQLTATVSPSDATNKTLSWASGNTAIATVNSSGLVTAVAAGTATITVTTHDGGKTATCSVSVSSGSTCSATGTILQQVWNNINGTSVSDLTGNSAYPESPSSSVQLNSFEAPTNVADNYGQRIAGYICAPVTGSYTFWIASDDNSQLWLSTDENASNKSKIAEVLNWTNSREWNKESTQKSATINLIAGQSYYVEALMKEGVGGDNLAVGWAKPGQSTSVPSEVVPGSVLSPLAISNIPVTGVSVSPTSATLTVGGTQQLTATVSPSDATNKTVTWSSSNASVATVNSSGLVTAVAAGTATITVTTQDGGKTATCSVSVSSGSTCSATGTILQQVWNNINGTSVSDLTGNSAYPESPSSSVQLNSFEAPTNVADNYGQRIAGYICAPVTGSYTFWIASDDNSQLWLSTDENASNKSKIAEVLDWTNSREWNKGSTQKSATINLIAGQSYYVEALMKEGGGGDNLAVGWAKPGQSTSAPSEVVPGSVLSPLAISNIPVTGVSVSPTSAPLTVGGTQQLTATVSPSDATNKTVTWSSSNASVATVNSSGLVMAVAAGTATITVTTQDGGFIATSAITVNTPNVAVTGVSVSPTTASINVGVTQQLTATVLPGDATNKIVTWSSSNASVATVNSSGLVMAVAAGTATVTATTQDGGFIATSAITVNTPNVAVTGVSVSPTTASINLGVTQQLTATLLPGDATNKTVTWSSSNASVATVNSSGLVTAVAAGTATVTATSQDGDFTATSAITVNSAINIHIEAESYSAVSGDIGTKTADGGTIVGWFDNNEYLDFSNINISTAATYTVNFRVATGLNATQIMIKNLSGVTLTTINVPANGWDTWENVTGSVTLPAGTQTLRVQVNGGIDFNWWEITSSTLKSAEIGTSIIDKTGKDSFSMFPNPVEPGASLKITGAENAMVRIMDLTGKIILVTKCVNNEIKIPASLKSGVYMLLVNSDRIIKSGKLIVK